MVSACTQLAGKSRVLLVDIGTQRVVLNVGDYRSTHAMWSSVAAVRPLLSRTCRSPQLKLYNFKTIFIAEEKFPHVAKLPHSAERKYVITSPFPPWP